MIILAPNKKLEYSFAVAFKNKIQPNKKDKKIAIPPMFGLSVV